MIVKSCTLSKLQRYVLIFVKIVYFSGFENNMDHQLDIIGTNLLIMFNIGEKEFMRWENMNRVQQINQNIAISERKILKKTPNIFRCYALLQAANFAFFI